MTNDPLARFRGPDGEIPDGVNIERELDLEQAAAERPDTDSLYDERLLRDELDEIGEDAARLSTRIDLCRYRLVRRDHHYMTNMLRDAAGAASGALALVQMAEHELLTGETVLQAVRRAGEEVTDAPPVAGTLDEATS